MKNRREFLRGTAAVMAATALPAIPVLAAPERFIGVDWGAAPSVTVWHKYWWDAEAEVMRITGIDAPSLFKRSASEK